MPYQRCIFVMNTKFLKEHDLLTTIFYAAHILEMDPPAKLYIKDMIVVKNPIFGFDIGVCISDNVSLPTRIHK